jgi:periplasmic protein TonB
VAYRTDVTNRDKGAAIAAVIAIHALLLFAVIHRWGGGIVAAGAPALKTFDVRNPPPPPPPPQPKVQPRPKEKEGGSAPPNIKSEATPVEVPRPKVLVPPVPQIAATETPRQGIAPTQGAAPFAGPGTGAGGTGSGTGSGAGGTGPGGGGGVAEPPHLATPVLTGRDIPRELLIQWPRGATVFMRLRVDPRGYVSECTVDHGTGVPAIDSAMCNVVHDRLRFRPALNRAGQAVAGWFGYAQRAPR